jgi:hypothetical protein
MSAEASDTVKDILALPRTAGTRTLGSSIGRWLEQGNKRVFMWTFRHASAPARPGDGHQKALKHRLS